MAKQTYLVSLDLNQNELQNLVLQNLATPPPSPKNGQVYYDTSTNQLLYWDGSKWAQQGIQLSDLSVATGSHLTYDSATGAFGIETNYSIPATSAFNAKISLTNLSSASAQLTYNNTNGQFSLTIDSVVTQNSTNLVTSGAVFTTIQQALIGGLNYVGTWDSTSQTNYSSISLPVKKGFMYLVTGTGTTISGVEWRASDYLIINKDVTAPAIITASDVDKIDNTESSDIVKLNTAQTLTNKTISAINNTIQDLQTTNFKSGVISTTIGASTTASDTVLPTQKAVALALESFVPAGEVTQEVYTNPALTPTGGQITWVVAHGLNSQNIISVVYDTTTNNEVYVEKSATSTTTFTIKFNSDVAVAVGAYKVLLMAKIN